VNIGIIGVEVYILLYNWVSFPIFLFVLIGLMQLSLSDLNLVYACTRDKTLMIDVQAREISEKDLAAGLRLAHPEVSLETCRNVLEFFYFFYLLNATDA
jgi:hypothetical protein